MGRTIEHKFSPYLANLLSEKDRQVVMQSIHEKIGYGYNPVNTYFPIRASQGLELCARIDVYADRQGVLFLALLADKE